MDEGGRGRRQAGCTSPGESVDIHVNSNDRKKWSVWDETGLADAVVLLEDLKAFTANVQRRSVDAAQWENLSILMLITKRVECEEWNGAAWCFNTMEALF